jgi:flagellar biosynthesis/type III secretory pathway M-ring protein FliF/YscJ
MDAWVWIVIAIVAVVVIAAVLFAISGSMKRRRIEKRRAQAADLRQESSAQFGRAKERQALADEQAQRAKQERVAAQQAAERAHEIDPDTD